MIYFLCEKCQTFIGLEGEGDISGVFCIPCDRMRMTYVGDDIDESAVISQLATPLYGERLARFIQNGWVGLDDEGRKIGRAAPKPRGQ